MAAQPTPATVRLLLSPEEAGQLLGISGKSVRRLVKDGKLPGSYLPMPKGSTPLRIHKRHVEQFAARAADEAERALDLTDLRDWRRGAGEQARSKKAGRTRNAAGLS